VAGFSLYEQPGIRPKNRDMTWQGWELRSADGLVAGISSTRRLAQAHNPHRHSNIIQGFQKLQIALAACRISETISAAGTSSTRNPP
jgi:hypothetical protein